MTDTLVDALNRAHPAGLPDHLRYLKLGQLFGGHLPQQLLAQDPAAQTYELATVEGLGLPYYSRAVKIDRAVARAGGVTGELTLAAYGATPSTGEIAVSPSGDIVTLASDAITSLDVYYRPVAGDVAEVTLPVATGVMTLPSHLSGKALLLLEAEATVVDTGGVSGAKIILVPATAATATTKAALSVDRTKVYFNNATDLVLQARVKLLVAPDPGLAAGLAAQPSTL